MKILLLGFGKIAYMPYLNFYLDALKDAGNAQVELLYWDRDGKPDAEVPAQISKAYKFEAFLEEQLPFKKKLKYFAKYRAFALKVLRQNRYDRIVVLQNTPGLTLLDYLILHYKGRYLVDFRDFSYEHIPVYRKLVALLSDKAACTFVSSNAFRRVLSDQTKVYTIHNYLEDSLKHIGLRNAAPRDREVLRVSFWGLVRQIEVNKRVIDALGNDPRFELHYYGRMQQEGRDTEEYARSKRYQNVYFHGPYTPPERYGFAADTEILHNLYDLGHRTAGAVGNKIYDGVIFEIPQICTKGSYMDEVITEWQVGIEVDLADARLADRLWDYYRGIDWPAFRKNCETARALVFAEQSAAKQRLMQFFE